MLTYQLSKKLSASEINAIGMAEAIKAGTE
jgi:hypothetical protein